MDQEQQPTVWPPAPKGMEPTLSPTLSTFRPAPTQWVIGSTIIYAVSIFFRSLCSLALASRHISVFYITFYESSQSFQAISSLAVTISFLVWFYRVYKNLDSFKTAGLHYTAGWAVAWFFIPVFNLFRPYQLGQTIWKASDPGANSAKVEGWEQMPGANIVRVWWGLSLLSNLLAMPVIISTYRLQVFHQTLGASIFYLESAISGAGHTAAAIITILFIRALSARQLAKEVARFWLAAE